MDENTWKLAQLAMGMMAIQTTIIIALFGGMWAHFNRRFDKIDARFEKVDTRFEKVDSRFEKVDARFDKLETLITNIDKRVFGIETMLHMKECCLLSENQKLKKAE